MKAESRVGEVMVSIPEPVRRVVRQQAGFGCCRCGLPIYEYHHIVKNSRNPNEIMLLCPNHHHEATVGAMNEEEQRLWKDKPDNLRRGFVHGKLKINQEKPHIVMGSTIFVGEGRIICVDQEALVSLRLDENYGLQLSVRLYDKNDNLVAEIENNEWITGDPLPWDLEAGFQTLRIRRRIGDISLDIDARRSPIELHADIWRKGQNYKISQTALFVNGVVVQASIIGGTIEGLCLNIDTSRRDFSVIPRS
jgi:hypothetical protein